MSALMFLHIIYRSFHSISGFIKFVVLNNINLLWHPLLVNRFKWVTKYYRASCFLRACYSEYSPRLGYFITWQRSTNCLKNCENPCKSCSFVHLFQKNSALISSKHAFFYLSKLQTKLDDNKPAATLDSLEAKVFHGTLLAPKFSVAAYPWLSRVSAERI